MTTFYPLCVDLEDRKCLVVGAGSVALRKIRNLVDAKADVIVVSRAAHPVVLDLAEEGQITLITRPYMKEDLDDKYLVVAATNNHELHAKIFKAATKKGMLCNAVDDLANCNFIVPSILKRGDLTISVSTNAATPFLARAIREYLGTILTTEWDELIEFGKILRKRNQQGKATAEEQLMFTDLWHSPLGIMICEGRTEEAMAFMQDYIGREGA